MSLMFVFTPTSQYTAAEAELTRRWVQTGGGTLIYASEQGDRELDRAFGVTRVGGYVPGGEYTATPVAAGVGRVAGGRTIMPLEPPPGPVARSEAEWSVAVGQLLRRSSARAVTLGLLAGATERAVATRTGLPLHPRERFWNALWVRAPEVAGDLAQIENSLVAASATERDLLNAAQRLHEIAHPAPSRRPAPPAAPLPPSRPPPRELGGRGTSR